MNNDEILAAVTALHQEIDELVAPLVERHLPRLQCGRGCAECCQDDLTVLEVEAARLRECVGDALRGAVPHPTGGCAFLAADGACRGYAARPFVCRTQGLPLRWLEDDGVEYRDICRLNAEGEDLADLTADECWTLGPFEQRLASLQLAAQASAGFAPPRRVALRALFVELASEA